MPTEPLSTVLSIARTYLNDDLAITWSDPALIPKVQEAHRELQTKLWAIGSPLVRKSTGPLTVPAGGTNMVNLSLQPVDLLVPTALYEASVNANDWLPMTEVAYFAVGILPTTQLIYWSWYEEQIIFVGATVDRRVVIHYRRNIPIPQAATDLIGILFAESYLAARAAAIAAGTLGNAEVYDKMTALSTQKLSELILANRGQQHAPMAP